jgi:hypothetical protein
MARPELVVLEGIGGDGILATKMHKEEGCPKYCKVLLAWRTTDREMTKSVHSGGVGHEVRQPKEDREYGRGYSPTGPSKDKENNLQCEAE